MKAEALWWTKEDDAVRCLLCPHACLLDTGEQGLCGVREGHRNGLSLPGFGMITAEAPDPIEKKPLYHFYPGEIAWSIGFAGCNLNCPFCQNHRIARGKSGDGIFMPSDAVINHAIENNAGILAYTYSEPTVHIEYLLECSQKASEAGLKNILVTNGNLNRKPAVQILDAMDAVNIDLKSWNPDYYSGTLGGNLNTVKMFIETALERCWVELTTLIVPGDNDSVQDMEDMSSWIASLSENIPLHLSAYHPSYKYTRSPTLPETIMKLKSCSGKKLNFVYPGNIGVTADTPCPGCGKTVIRRFRYSTESSTNAGACPVCGTIIPGRFPGKPLRSGIQT